MGSGASQQKQQLLVTQQVLNMGQPVSPLRSKSIDKKAVRASQGKQDVLKTNNSQVATRNFKSQDKRKSIDDINKSSTFKRQGSEIRIKQSRRSSEYSLKNPEAQKMQLKSTRQHIKDASMVIEMNEENASSPSNAKRSAVSRISQQDPNKPANHVNKKKFDPKLSELIKLYGFT